MLAENCRFALPHVKGCTIHVRCKQQDQIDAGTAKSLTECPDYAKSDCECTEDGYCSRYRREMRGRFREICRGENVDAGTAQNYRSQWMQEAITIAPIAPLEKCKYLGEKVTVDGETVKRECGPCGGKNRMVFHCEHPARKPDQITLPDCAICNYRPRGTAKKKLILKNLLSPGDVLVMTAAIHSLHRANPGEFATAVRTFTPDIFEFNPDVIPLTEADGADEIEMHYPAINQADGRAIHFMQGYCEFLADVLKVRVPLLTNRPHVYLSCQERGWISQVEEATKRRMPFWVISAGRKADYTTKFWGSDRFQAVVDDLRGKILFVQVGAADHHHPPLRNVVNLIGKTDHRQLIRLCYHAQGVLTGVTYLQHLAAALEKPSVVIMGGREPVAWNTYPRQHLLHTIGSALPCCHDKACWKSRVEPIADGDADKNNSLCEFPIVGDEMTPKCMTMITLSEVVQKILMLSG